MNSIIRIIEPSSKSTEKQSFSKRWHHFNAWEILWNILCWKKHYLSIVLVTLILD